MKRINTLLAAIVVGITATAQENRLITISEAQEPMMTGRFEPTWESLSQYETPEWFRDAKFGIWAHWGPQCVEGSGDWMARGLYIEDSYQYRHHLENYGHPSEFGFKDLLPLFKAENWDPDRLVALYKKIGARYFLALGNHHDNFDLWDSKYQEWNSQAIGPHRDLLAGWAEACRKHGLKFGVSLHSDRAWAWYETSRRYDRNGDKACVPYDGNLTAADGKGKWWEGLDPQNLYVQNHPESKGTWSDGAIHRYWKWSNGVSLPTAEYCTNFYNRTLDVINRYNPDLLYFDVAGVPFHPISDAGLKIAAHFYNHNAATRGADGFSAVMFGKVLDDTMKKALVWDVERGAPNNIPEKPWQTCSCLGDWHYNTNVYRENRYKSASTVIKLLADIVSKNGNLLLSIPLRADGTFDEKEEEIINSIGEWMDTNGESIYSTRPWHIFGEGPIADADIAINVFGFNEGSYMGAGADDIRFTQTPNHLYAIALAWPENGQVTVKSLAKGSQLHKKGIRNVELLGYGKVPFKRTADGLCITIPSDAQRGIIPVFRIRK
ncbi:MAG: alpha-L-fucosidase [Paenibacillus sp.]|nr:alpha-L-fucosidase [Paenibacillus sp.]